MMGIDQERSQFGAGVCQNPEDLILRVRQFEQAQADHYAEAARHLDFHNNKNSAEWFERLSRLAQERADLLGSGPVPEPDLLPAPGEYGDLHYLMRPYHVLRIALENEHRLLALLSSAIESGAGAIEGPARDLADRKRRHIALLDSWIKEQPLPEPGWDEDPDPPNYDL